MCKHRHLGITKFTHAFQWVIFVSEVSLVVVPTAVRPLNLADNNSVIIITFTVSNYTYLKGTTSHVTVCHSAVVQLIYEPGMCCIIATPCKCSTAQYKFCHQCFGLTSAYLQSSVAAVTRPHSHKATASHRVLYVCARVE